MPRSTRSTRAAPATAAAPESARKRRASARVAAAGDSSAALKKRKYDSSAPNKSTKSTSKTSKYFQKNARSKSKVKAKSEAELDDDLGVENDPKVASPDSDHDSSDAGSDFWRRKESTTAGKEALSSAINQFKRKRSTQTVASESSEKEELWREGVKTGLGPGKEVFIKKPKARDPGDTPYKDETLHPNTMLFLEDLAKNNDRQWLKGNIAPILAQSCSKFLTDINRLVAHDADYRASKKDWDTFVETLTEKVTEQDGTIPELPAKDLVRCTFKELDWRN
jgi:hypothetical protein